jgi:ribosomal protein L37AE/L43A
VGETKKMHSDKKKYRCTVCKYEFTRKISALVNTCPYCGKASVEELTDDYADSILKEVDRLK